MSTEIPDRPFQRGKQRNPKPGGETQRDRDGDECWRQRRKKKKNYWERIRSHGLNYETDAKLSFIISINTLSLKSSPLRGIIINRFLWRSTSRKHWYAIYGLSIICIVHKGYGKFVKKKKKALCNVLVLCWFFWMRRDLCQRLHFLFPFNVLISFLLI